MPLIIQNLFDLTQIKCLSVYSKLVSSPEAIYQLKTSPISKILEDEICDVMVVMVFRQRVPIKIE